MTIGDRIKQPRTRNNMTQEKLAERLCVSCQAVSKWECGVSNPDLALIAPLTQIFHTSADELLGIQAASVSSQKKKYDMAYENTGTAVMSAAVTGGQRMRWARFRVIISTSNGSHIWNINLRFAKTKSRTEVPRFSMNVWEIRSGILKASLKTARKRNCTVARLSEKSCVCTLRTDEWKQIGVRNSSIRMCL